MKRTYTGILRILFFLLLQCIAQGDKLPQEPFPNIILVITDDQGYGDLSCHGSPIAETPNVDRLYADGLRLTNYHVDPTCAPTRSALMTGRYSNRVGVWHTIQGRSMLRKREITLPQILKENAYATGLFGKWHLGDTYPYRPMDRGFTHAVYHGAGGVGQTPDYWGNDYFDDIYCFNGTWKQTKGFCTDVFFDEAKKFIRTNKDRPFFAYISTNAPHSPFRAPEKYLDAYMKHPLLENYKPRKNAWKKRSQADCAAFYGMIANIDDNFGSLWELLVEEGIEENTLLIFTTDNGSVFSEEFYNAGMRGGKASRYEGGHRVPWIMRWPGGHLSGGRDIDVLTAHLDILPTLIDLLDLEAPAVSFDGSSLKGAIEGGESGLEDRTLIVESQRVRDPIKWRNTTVMRGPWRYSVLDEQRELFDLRTDPGQRMNIAEQHPEVVRSLIADYDAFWADVSKEHALYTRPEVGSARANPVVLTSHDHVTQGATVSAWNQWHHIYDGVRHDAPWYVDFVTGGMYEVSIRRWPIEQDWSINEHPEEGQTKGRFNANRAYLELNGKRLEQALPNGAKEVTFRLEVEPGPAVLNAGFIEEGGARASAYYAYILHTGVGQVNPGWNTHKGSGLIQKDWTDAPEWEAILRTSRKP